MIEAHTPTCLDRRPPGGTGGSDSSRISGPMFTLLAGACFMCVDTSAHAAADAQAWLAVGASVSPVARIESMNVPGTIRIGEADVVRGYVDIDVPVELRVFGNDGGYLVDFIPAANWLAGFTVKGLGAEVDLPSQGGTLARRLRDTTREVLSLRLRLRLSAGVVPASYAWPLHLAVHPLPGRTSP
jgi:hypothetical protein